MGKNEGGLVGMGEKEDRSARTGGHEAFEKGPLPMFIGKNRKDMREKCDGMEKW